MTTSGRWLVALCAVIGLSVSFSARAGDYSVDFEKMPEGSSESLVSKYYPGVTMSFSGISGIVANPSAYGIPPFFFNFVTAPKVLYGNAKANAVTITTTKQFSNINLQVATFWPWPSSGYQPPPPIQATCYRGGIVIKTAALQLQEQISFYLSGKEGYLNYYPIKSFGTGCDKLVVYANNILWVDGFNADTSKVSPSTVYLLLHGLNSDPSTWNSLVDKTFSGICPVLDYESVLDPYAGTPSYPHIPKSSCYRYHFKTRDVDGYSWPNGDGATFPELGEEVALAVSAIYSVNLPDSIVLVGHSRGGLAARAFLQDPYLYDIPFGMLPKLKLGLLTIGSPHQGSPFGRLKLWMDLHGYGPNDTTFESRKFVFSPSTGYLATDHNSNGVPIRSSLSEAIWALNDRIPHLTETVSVLGQIVSYDLILGEDAAMFINLLDGTSAARMLPGDFNSQKYYILLNIATISLGGSFCTDTDTASFSNWACNGDGVVPYISQRIAAIPGYVGGKPMYTKTLKAVFHTGETSQTAEIEKVLNNMTKALQ